MSGELPERFLVTCWQDCRRGEWPALGCPLPPLYHHPIQEHSSLEVATNQLQQPLVAYPPSQPAHQEVVVHAVEELLQVQIHDPVSAVHHVFQCLVECLVSTLPDAETVAVWRKRRVVQRV